MSRGLTPAVQAQLLALHAQGQLNHELAAALGVSVATVKRWKRVLSLGANCPDNLLGLEAERFVLTEARARGLTAAHSGPHSHPFDLVISGQRVDVKAASYSPAYRGWRFRLPRWRSSFNSTARRTPKAYERDCEWLALVGLDADTHRPAFLRFVQPTAALTNVTVSDRDLPRGFTANWDATDLVLRPAA